MIITPPYLQSGDTVGLVATARKVVSDEIAAAIEVLQQWGLKVEMASNLFLADHQYAGCDSHRASALQSFLDRSTDLSAILAVRGGYGTVRIVDQLDFTRFQSSPKWIIGYSDLTVLHAHIHQNQHIKTIHGMMAFDFPKSDEQPCSGLQTLHDALFGKPLHYSFSAHPQNRFGSCEGEIVGGNLSVLQSISGSASDIETDHKILFLEDLDEYLYHIDRMLLQLKRCGKLARLNGLLVGSFNKMHDNAVSFGKTPEEIIREAVSEYHFPLFFNFPAGHLGAENHAIRLGERVVVSGTPLGSSFRSPA